MTDIRSLEQTLLENLPWNKARIKFVARFLLALYTVQTVNLSLLANAFSGSAQVESNYKRLQRFLRQFEMPYAELAEFVVRMLGVPGPYTLALDRTNWQFGGRDINLLVLGIVGQLVVWLFLTHLQSRFLMPLLVPGLATVWALWQKVQHPAAPDALRTLHNLASAEFRQGGYDRRQLDGLGLVLVAQRSGRAMGIDVANVCRC